ncbi:hypothetical protein [Tsuneonella sp. HG222]
MDEPTAVAQLDHDEAIRLACLQMACTYADDDQMALNIAMMFQEYVENGCSGICGGCLQAMGGSA